MTIGQAVAALRRDAGLSQIELAEAVEVDQRTISRLESDAAADRDPDRLLAIEKACKRPPGTILRAAGYVLDGTSTEDAIEADSHLDRQHRELLVETYRLYVDRSQRGK